MPAAPAGTAPHHPALTSSSEAPLIPAGENRMGVDLLHFDDPKEGGNGRTTGHMYLPGYSSDADGDPYVYQERPGGPWRVNSLPGGMPEQEARTPQELMAKVARLYGVHGEMRVTDERENAPRNMSGTRTLAPAPAKKAAVPVAGTGPGVVPIGASDADRRAARPRMEGETDRAYAVRTAPTREAALGLLNGHQAAGLRAIARDEGVVTSGTKADLVARLIRVMRDRHEDSAAIERMVNRDRTPAAPKVKAEDLKTGDMVQVGGTWGLVKNVHTFRGTDLPTEVQVSYDGGARKEWVNLDAVTAHESRRANAAAAASGSITPTMTGSQLIAARRRLQAEQQGRTSRT